MLKYGGKWLVNTLALLVTFAVLVLASLMLLNRAPSAGAVQPGTVISLVPPARAGAGEVTSVKLVASNAANLAGFQATVIFDAASLRFAGATVESGLEQGGRGLIPLGPATREGAVAIGAATCPAADCSDTEPEKARQQSLGVDGTVELATIEFLPGAPGRYTLLLEGVQLVDPQGNLQAATPAHAELVVE